MTRKGIWGIPTFAAIDTATYFDDVTITDIQYPVCGGTGYY